MTQETLQGKIAFIAGVGDDNGYGWSIAKELHKRGATILFGVWTPIMRIFTTSWDNGKFDASRKHEDGSMLEYGKVYALDAAYDTPEEVPEEVKENKRYKGASSYTISEVAEQVKSDYGHIDIFVHSLANGPEVKNRLLETSRAGYLAAISASAYSFVSAVQHFGAIMKKGGAFLNLTYLASERAVPGYGGGMSSAKAALESDTRTLAFEAGRKWGIRINSISAGALASRAAKAIGFIEKMIGYAKANAPLEKDLTACEVGNAAAFLLGPESSAVTGVVLYVDNGIHAMGVSCDSPTLS
ncbi:MAG: enoyl-[acyl-carrier-protein] reductase [Simkaniaceae bacterium]|nr:enoyl-[acyl-carrier-protein] reductase [Simkaniaceae bacterium]